MKYIITESQFHRLNLSLNEDVSSPSDLKELELVLNKKMIKKFPWFKKINIDSIGHSALMFSTVNFYGTFYVDYNWAHDNWKKLHPHISFSDIPGISDLLDSEEWESVTNELLKYYNLVVGDVIERARIGGMDVVLIRDSSKKMEQTEGELTEKCWAGYTQKGMKTMFGKRYPNCVKKKN